MLALTSALAAPTLSHGVIWAHCDRRRRRAGRRASQPHVLGLLIFWALRCERRNVLLGPRIYIGFSFPAPLPGISFGAMGGNGWSDTCASGNPNAGVPNPRVARLVHLMRGRHTVLFWRSCVPGRAGNARRAQTTRSPYGWRSCSQLLRSRGRPRWQGAGLEGPEKGGL